VCCSTPGRSARRTWYDDSGHHRARQHGAEEIKGSPKWGDLLLRIVAGLVLFYLFLPIFVIVLFSFNNPQGKFNYSWQGFTLKNWADPFKYPALTDALKLSLNVAAVSTAVAVVLGTLVAIALVRQRFRGQSAVDNFLVIPLTAPEVVMGAALLTLFLDFGWAAGYTTIVISHIAFEISFIAMTVRARCAGSTGHWRTRRWTWARARPGRSSK